MDFGRLTEDEKLEDLIVGLPPVHSTLQSIPRTTLHLGAPLWGSDHFRGTLYPKETRKTDYLKEYSLQLDVLELNTTYHSIPSEEQVANWKNAVSENPRFLFHPKCPRIISHEGRIDHHIEELSMFTERIRGFGPHLGTSFLQLSVAFTPSRIHELSSFLDLWPEDLKLALEVRHLAWFKNQHIKESLRSLLEAKKISWVITDTPGIQDVLHQEFTVPEVLMRFVTTGFHAKDLERMQAWSLQFTKYAEYGVRDIHFIVHERDEWLVRSILKKMEELNHAHLDVRALPPLETGPVQLALF